MWAVNLLKKKLFILCSLFRLRKENLDKFIGTLRDMLEPPDHRIHRQARGRAVGPPVHVDR